MNGTHNHYSNYTSWSDFSFFGPEAGRRHDLTLFRDSSLEQELQENLIANDIQYYIFGDSAYMLRTWIQRPFLHGTAEESERILNKQMSFVRVSVEQNYKDLKQYWIGQDFHPNHKFRKAPIELIYKSCIIILNFHVFLWLRTNIRTVWCMCTEL